MGFFTHHICDGGVLPENKEVPLSCFASEESVGIFPRLFAIMLIGVFIIGLPVICFIVVVKSLSVRPRGGVSSGVLMMFGTLVLIMAVVGLIFAMIAGRNTKDHTRRDFPADRMPARSSIPNDPDPATCVQRHDDVVRTDPFAGRDARSLGFSDLETDEGSKPRNLAARPTEGRARSPRSHRLAWAGSLNTAPPAWPAGRKTPPAG